MGKINIIWVGGGGTGGRMQSEELLCMLTCTVAIDVKLSKVGVASTTTASGVGEADNDPLAAPLSLQILQRLSRQGRVPSYGRCVLTRFHTAYPHVLTLHRGCRRTS